jgi:hypothetical protein
MNEPKSWETELDKKIIATGAIYDRDSLVAFIHDLIADERKDAVDEYCLEMIERMNKAGKFYESPPNNNQEKES